MISVRKSLSFRGLVAPLALALLLGGITVPVAGVAQERPLLMEGKQATFQRVLTRPGATLHAAPEAAVAEVFPPFQPLYVYAREGEWLRIGPSASAGPTGWVQAGAVVDWKQNITGAFTNSAGRNRQILFETREALEALMNNEDVLAMQADLLAQSDSGGIEAGSGAISVEPLEFINIRDELYMMPILSFEETLHPLNYEPTLLLELASIPNTKAPALVTETQAEPFDAGVVFVLDTTRSMGPYIESTRDAVKQIVEQIRGTDVGDRVQFGVIGFRDNPESDPDGIGYRTKMLAPLKHRPDQTEVIDAIRDAADVATASTPGFNEDSLAGIEDAIDAIDWEPKGESAFEGRYVILITDAGPNESSDPDARSEIGPAELQADAEEKGIAILTLHLRTPSGGSAQHDYAETAYRALSAFGGQDLYYPVENGDEAIFSEAIERLVAALTDTIRVTLGQEPALPQEEAAQEIANLGRAMQLAWLGGQEGVTPPDILRGWMSEKAVDDPTRLAVEPRLVVTKNEMATMADLLQGLLEAGEQNRSAEEADAFFGQVQSVIAQMAQNPDRMVDADAEGPAGALEFLEDLPYRSQLLQLDRETWAQSAVQRRAILDGMRRKLVQYRKWLLDAEVWTALYDNASDGEHVFAMPFDVLP